MAASSSSAGPSYGRKRRYQTTSRYGGGSYKRRIRPEPVRMYVPRVFGTPLALGETKYFDTHLASTAITASTDWTGTEKDPTTLNCLFAPTSGPAINQRQGRRVEVQKIKIRGFVRTPAAANVGDQDPGAMVRLILFMDSQTNTTQAQGEQLMAAPGVASADLCPTTFQNLENFGRFRVLRDFSISLDAPSGTYDGTDIEQGGLMRPFKINITFKNPIRVHFNATDGGTIADIVDNSFHFLAIANSVNMTPQLVYSARVSYKDA